MKPPHHPQEAARIETLHGLGILDTPREKDFDDLVALAGKLTDCPICIVNLIDRDRTWFKSEVGTGMTESDLNISVCAHAIVQGEYLEVPDLGADPRFANNPLLGPPFHLRFYAGAVLRARNGLPIGTLCVFDTRVRTLTPLQVETIKVLARQVMTQIDHRHDLAEAELTRQEVDHRTKNSLQAIASLIRLQVRRAKSDDLREALDKVLMQIETVSALHQTLYETSSSSHVDIGLYGRRLGSLLQRLLPADASLEIDLDPFNMSSRQAANFGVLVNEFVTNSAKHAFPDGRKGTVRLTGRRRATDYEMTLSDDGVGFKTMPDGHLGLRVMEAAAENLGALSVDLDGKGGATLRLAFPL